MKKIFFLILGIIILKGNIWNNNLNAFNNLYVLEKKVADLKLNLNLSNNIYQLSINFNVPSPKKKSHYYLVNYDELFRIREIKKYNFRNNLLLKITLNKEEKVISLQETIPFNVNQKREFSAEGLLLYDKVYYLNNASKITSSKSKAFTYNQQNKLVEIKYFKNEKLNAIQKIENLSKDRNVKKIMKISLFNPQKELVEYRTTTTEKKISQTEFNQIVEISTTNFNSNHEKIFSSKKIYLDHHLQKQEIVYPTIKKIIDYFYNPQGQLVSKTIRGKTFNQIKTFQYQYLEIPQDNYLMFNNNFKMNLIEGSKKFWLEELKIGNINFSNHYQNLVSSFSYYLKGNQIYRTEYKIDQQSLLVEHLKQNRIIKKEIYDYRGEKIGEDKYTYYINGFLKTREFKSTFPAKSRRIIFQYQELTLNKKGYEKCRSNYQMIERINFNFGHSLFLELSKKAKAKKINSFRKDFNQFINELSSSQQNQIILDKLFFIEKCKLKKIILLEPNDRIMAYLRIKTIKEKKLKRIIVNYYQQAPIFYYSKKKENLIFYDQKKEFFEKTNNKLPDYAEKISTQFTFNLYKKQLLNFAEKKCFNSHSQLSGSVTINRKKITIHGHDRNCLKSSTNEKLF